MKVNGTLTEIRKEFAAHNAHMNGLLRKEEEEKNAARKAHLAKPYKRSEHAKPFSFEA
jgi:hypothetical protein